MISTAGSLSGSFNFCVCPSTDIGSSVIEPRFCSFSSPRNRILRERNAQLRCRDTLVLFSLKSLTSSERVEGGGKMYTVTSVGRGIVRASRSDSTLNAEATDRKSNEQSIAGPSVQSHLDLLERFTSEGAANNVGRTIAEQLESQVDVDEAEEVAVPLAQNVSLENAPLTIHQKRNIRRQRYLDEVAKRNDAPFFTTVALIVILPPSVILGVAVATGYIQLFP